MQVVFRNLLAVSFLVWGASCALNDSGLGGTDAKGSRSDAGALTGSAGSSAAGTSGAAGTTGPTGGGGSNVISTGVAGDGGGASGAAGDTALGGAGGDSATGAAGDIGTTGTGGSTNGSAGVSGSAGSGGTAGTGAAGTGAAGTGAAGTGAAGTGAAGTGAAGTGAAGTTALGPPGCADGTREGFTDRAKYPKIASCSGGWEEPGLVSAASKVPKCDRNAGNDGDRSDGHGCSVADLCASGWHVCESAKVVATNAGSCADAVKPTSESNVFFVTRQRGTSFNTVVICDAVQPGTNNLFGCGTGTLGNAPEKSCAPLTRTLRDSDCRPSFPWACAEGPLGTSQNELDVVTKRGSLLGGALCCKD